MDQETLHNLIKRYQNDKLTEEELLVLKNFLDTPRAQDLISEVWDKTLDFKPFNPDNIKPEGIFRQIMADHRLLETAQENKKFPTRPIWTNLALATSILLAITVGAMFLFTKYRATGNEEILAHIQEVKPGSVKARIEFDSGQIIELDKIQTGTILEENGVHIVKQKDGTIAYELKSNQDIHTPTYNTIITPRGGEYSVVLPDGSRVWLNTASRLRYPIAFNSKKREVELEGEAYFEVVQQNTKEGKRIPFIVRTQEQELEVLGTSFNINSYNQNIITTLVEGSVALTYANTRQKQVLEPSQQSTYSKKEKRLSVAKVDPFYTIAWKSGKFAFNDASIYEVMEDIARWYDIEVNYQGDLSSVRYSGTISRFEDFKQLLQIIEWTDLVTLKVDGRRITIMK